MNNKVVKDALFGAIGGVAGTFVIDEVMGLISRFQSDHDKWIERELVREQPTEALAQRVVQERCGIELNKQRKQQLGRAVHWGYGIVCGAIYGVLRDKVPFSSKAAGLPFGIALGMIGPGVLLPLLDLTPPAKEFPVSSQVRGLLSHYAYAATVEGVCTALEAVDEAVATQQIPTRTNPELRKVS